MYKDGSTVRYVGTVRYASIFAKKYCTLVRCAFFVMIRVRYVGTLFELIYQTFRTLHRIFVCRGIRQLKPTLTV